MIASLFGVAVFSAFGILSRLLVGSWNSCGHKS
ncbi:ABC transporter permease [Rhodococcus opacus M213]|uniref:ABC transporter permease n=1 Tax=Rhodococcus opacus M213 TaxID=1129896 RepID=K8XGU0_RHOOP|nr:ABC transporter permease [Rhodococcus opacus M213]